MSGIRPSLLQYLIILGANSMVSRWRNRLYGNYTRSVRFDYPPHPSEWIRLALLAALRTFDVQSLRLHRVRDANHWRAKTETIQDEGRVTSFLFLQLLGQLLRVHKWSVHLQGSKR